MSELNHDLDQDEDEDEGYTPGEGLESDESDPASDTAHGPVGGGEFDDIGPYPDDDVSELEPDEFRQSLIDELADVVELPRQREADPSAPSDIPLSSEAEARLDYDDTDSGDAEVSEAQLTERYEQQKADAELAAHRAFLENALADARAAREAAQRPPQAPQVEVVPPPLMAQASEAQFEAILAARAQGLDSLPSGEVADLPAFYGSLIQRDED